MNNNERHIYDDIPGSEKRARFHSAILTSYSIELIPFEHQMLSQLHRHEISSINLLIDENQFDRAMMYLNPSSLEEVGREYCLTLIPSLGAFHPKINFFVGDEDLMVVWGSGNLTMSGHGKNHETFSGFMVDKSNRNQLPLLQECWMYLQLYVKLYGSKTVKHRVLKEVPAYCKWLKQGVNVEERHQWHPIDEKTRAALLYNEEGSSIYSQLLELIPVNQVKEITVVSPFYDEDGQALMSLLDLCPNARLLNVLMQSNCSLPPSKITNHPKIHFYDFDKTERGTESFGPKDYSRRLHSKLFHFKTEQSEYIVIGSANATIAALGSMEEDAINDEFCAVYECNNSDVLKVLGLKKRRPLDTIVQKMRREGSAEGSDSTKYRIHICEAEYRGRKLQIKARGAHSDQNFSVMMETRSGVQKVDKVCFDDKGGISLDVALPVQTTICYLADANGNRASNRLYIQWPTELESTNPSRENRSINRFIARLESEGYDSLKVIDMVTSLMREATSEEEERMLSSTHGLSSQKRTSRGEDISLAYDPRFELPDEELGIKTHMGASSSVSRLLDSIINMLKQRALGLEEAVTSEEEEADATESHTRDMGLLSKLDQQKMKDEEIYTKNDVEKAKKELKSKLGRNPSETEILDCISHNQYIALTVPLQKLLKNWDRLNEARKEYMEKHSDDNRVYKSDLSFTSIVIMVVTQLCLLNKLRTYSTRDEEDLVDRYMKNCMGVLTNFALSCNGKVTLDNSHPDFIFEANRFMTIALMATTTVFNVLSEKQLNYCKTEIELALAALMYNLGKPEAGVINELMYDISKECNFEFRVEEVVSLSSHIEELINSGTCTISYGYWCYKRNGKKDFYLKDEWSF